MTYIIFTSGSAGEPKGVQISALNLNNFIAWSQLSFSLSANQVFMNQALLSFDLSIFELVNALSLSASLVLMDNKTMLFQTIFLAYRCNVWVSTPSFAFAFGFDKAFNSENFPCLILMILCGGVLPTKLAGLLLSHFTNLQLFNTYGPTEVTVMVSSIQINQKILNTYNQFPIGNINTTCHIDTQNSGIFEKNVTGELLISGQSVSIGYLNANNDSFTTNKEGCALLCYWRHGLSKRQQIVFFWTPVQDDMIKYNGHRIDLGEINHVIGQLTDIFNVRTLPSEYNRRIIRLVAFIQTSDCNVDVVNAYLEPRLPKYMIPNEYVFHADFLLTRNLKVDNQLLLKQYMDF
ncbi:AMP-binding protein [Abyssogena phaseoliformis symbiont]|uniref:AMP-binding protein n=1 Tax=Abyssogena phaseoliformis symbiont TaxID=596095 RepID=UPI0019167642|nr:AMP-binding protein [Abyssogena phaseoliformis symbiont]